MLDQLDLLYGFGLARSIKYANLFFFVFATHICIDLLWWLVESGGQNGGLFNLLYFFINLSVDILGIPFLLCV